MNGEKVRSLLFFVPVAKLIHTAAKPLTMHFRHDAANMQDNFPEQGQAEWRACEFRVIGNLLKSCSGLRLSAHDQQMASRHSQGLGSRNGTVKLTPSAGGLHRVVWAWTKAGSKANMKLQISRSSNIGVESRPHGNHTTGAISYQVRVNL